MFHSKQSAILPIIDKCVLLLISHSRAQSSKRAHTSHPQISQRPDRASLHNHPRVNIPQMSRHVLQLAEALFAPCDNKIRGARGTRAQDKFKRN